MRHNYLHRASEMERLAGCRGFNGRHNSLFNIIIMFILIIIIYWLRRDSTQINIIVHPRNKATN